MIPTNQEETFCVTSFGVIRDYLEHHPELVRWLSFKEAKPRDKKWRELKAKALQLGLAVVSASEVRSFWSGRGVGAAGIHVPVLDQEGFLSEVQRGDTGHCVALDHVSDPRNVGAIARSAAFFGFRYLVLPERRQCPITDVVVQTAQGAFMELKVVHVKNLHRFLLAAKEHRYWALGADIQGSPLSKAQTDFERVVMCLGNEEKGLSRLVRDTCDVLVQIESSASQGVESLNVSVAAGILLHSICHCA